MSDTNLLASILSSDAPVAPSILAPSDAPTPTNVVTANFSGLGTGRGTVDVTASNEWATRPNDERFPTVLGLHEAALKSYSNSGEEIIRLGDVKPTVEDGKLMFELKGVTKPVFASNFAFTKLIAETGEKNSGISFPTAASLRSLSPGLVASILDEVVNHPSIRDREIKTLIDYSETTPVMTAVTSPSYGRVFDWRLSELMLELVLKHGYEVPIAFHKPGMVYNPVVAANVTQESTTCYRGRQSSFIFLVNQQVPVQVGTLADGSPRLFFRGIYAKNSEVGDGAIEFVTFLYEMVCCNRMIWGQRGLERLYRRHTKNASDRFDTEMVPAMMKFINNETAGVEAGLLAAMRDETPASMTVDQQIQYLKMTLDIGLGDGAAVLDAIMAEEGRKAVSAFDWFQGITATARSIPNADARVARELKGAELIQAYMAKAA